MTTKKESRLMAMQVGEHDTGEDVPMSDINTTPLVDVMLVLLIIFLITVPVVIQSVPITLPQVRNEITETKPENVSLTVRGGPGGTCEVYWDLTPVNNEQLLDRAVKALEDQIAKVGGVENINDDNMPEVHIRGDINTPYKCIGGTVFTMQRAGFARVGFISQPPPGGPITRL
jgi:biopolymer transport protein ExbD